MAKRQLLRASQTARRDLIAAHLKRHGFITETDAGALYGAKNLRAIVHGLRGAMPVAEIPGPFGRVWAVLPADHAAVRHLHRAETQAVEFALQSARAITTEPTPVGAVEGARRTWAYEVKDARRRRYLPIPGVLVRETELAARARMLGAPVLMRREISLVGARILKGRLAIEELTATDHRPFTYEPDVGGLCVIVAGARDVVPELPLRADELIAGWGGFAETVESRGGRILLALSAR